MRLTEPPGKGTVKGRTKKLHAEEARSDKERSRSLRKMEDELRQRQVQSHVAVQRSFEPQESYRPETEFDFFVSHSSEDKKAVAEPLASALRERGCAVWIDKSEIRVGDSLRQRVDDGLKRSRFGIVILSRSFLAGRTWTTRELNGLFVREEQSQEPRILPIWHYVTKDEVAAYSPILADKAALKTADFTIEEMADLLVERLGRK